MQLSAHSPNLNSIAHLRGEMESVQNRASLPASSIQLWDALASSWASIPLEHVQCLIDFIPQKTDCAEGKKLPSAITEKHPRYYLPLLSVDNVLIFVVRYCNG